MIDLVFSENVRLAFRKILEDLRKSSESGLRELVTNLVIYCEHFIHDKTKITWSLRDTRIDDTP